MTIKQVSKFQTSDGRLFNEKVDALSHENNLNATAELTRLLGEGLKSAIGPAAAVQHILLEATMVVAILKGYLKHLPKEAVEKQPVLARAA